MRASNHSGRTYKNGNSYNVNHNDRQFESEQDQHIDRDLSTHNKYLTIDDGEISELAEGKTLREHELDMYEKLYAESLAAKNDKAIAQRHPERIKNMEMYLDGRQTCPEEEILQIGKMGEFEFKDENGDLDLDKVKVFEQCVKDYIREHNEKFPGIQILDAAIHVDESSLHCHLRKTYTVPDKEGNLEVSQHRCLEKLGYELPKPEEKRGRANNLKIPYTFDKRDLWLGICERNLNIELEHEPAPENMGLTTSEYRLIAQAKKVQLGEQILDKQREQINEKQEHVYELDGQIRSKNKEVSKLDHELGEVSSSLQDAQKSLLKAQNDLDNTNKVLKDAQDQIKPQIEAYKTITDGVQNHNIPNIEIGEDKAFLREPEFFVKIPCKSQKQAQELQKEVKALYMKDFTQDALTDVINQQYINQQKQIRSEKNKALQKIASERQQAEEKISREREQADLAKTETIRNTQIYKSLSMATINSLGSDKISALLKQSLTEQIVEDSINDTIDILRDNNFLAKDIYVNDRLTIQNMVKNNLGDRIHELVDRVIQKVIEKASKLTHKKTRSFDYER